MDLILKEWDYNEHLKRLMWDMSFLKILLLLPSCPWHIFSPEMVLELHTWWAYTRDCTKTFQEMNNEGKEVQDKVKFRFFWLVVSDLTYQLYKVCLSCDLLSCKKFQINTFCVTAYILQHYRGNFATVFVQDLVWEEHSVSNLRNYCMKQKTCIALLYNLKGK